MTFVSDAAQQLLSCFDVALHEGPNPPADEHICLRVGEVPFSVGLSEDLCCSGFAWVRVLRIFPSVSFPQQDSSPNNCQRSSYAVEFEMGAVRCLPFGDVQAGASCAEWTSVFLQVDEDAASMRRAVCCLFDMIDAGMTNAVQIVKGDWTPIDGQGMCIGGTMRVTVQIDCNECAE